MTRPIAHAVRHCLASLGATAVILATVARSEAQDEGTFHEVETKYIFGFTVGSSVGLEGEKAFEPVTVGRFGKRTGTYAATETELEYEFTPNQYMQIELGPTVSYYNVHNVTDINDRTMASLNGFAGEVRYLILDRGPSRWRPNRNGVVVTKPPAKKS
jgi:hypothetical protein